MQNVGFSTGEFFDEERCNWTSDGRRPIAWSAWYPAKDRLNASINATRDASASLFVKDDVMADAVPVRGHFLPTVIFSHGTGGSAAGMSWFALRLAAAGYLVLGVDHHGNTATEKYRPEGFLCWWERARDLTVLLDHQMEDGPFAGLIDPDRIFVAGFSLGGYTAVACLGALTYLDLYRQWAGDSPLGRGPREFPNAIDHLDQLLGQSAEFAASMKRQSLDYADTRFKAALLCAPAPTVRGFTDESVRAIHVPVLTFVGGADREAPADPCAKWLDDRLRNSRLERLAPDIGHYVFLNECTEAGCQAIPEICVDAPGVDRRAIHDRVAAAAITFFAGIE